MPRPDRSLAWLSDVGRDIGYALRTLKRSPAFTVTALVSLALGMAATAGIFSLVDQVLLRALRGVHDPQRLVLLNWNGRDLATDYGRPPLLSYPICRELQEQRQVFDGVFCRHPAPVYLSTGKQHDLVAGEIVSGSYFSVLGVHAAFGRLIDPSDDLQPGAHPVVVLSYDYWSAQLGSPSTVIGQRVLINNHPMTVIGIAPPSFRGVALGEPPAVWIPAMMKRQATPEWDRLFDRRTAWMHVFGRLKADVTIPQATGALQGWFSSMLKADVEQPELAGVQELQRRQFLSSTLEMQAAAQGWSELRDTLTRPLWVLMGGTAVLLLLTASNVAGLLLARGAARTRELTTRMALGATRGRLTRQLLVESLLMTLGGGLLGLLAAPAVSQLLLSFVERDADLSARLDHRVFLFTLIVCLLTGIVCGLAPIFHIRRLSFSERTQVQAVGGVRFRKALVIGQMAFTLILLIGAGLFMQTVARLHAKAPGAAGRVIMFQVDPQGIGYPPAEARRFMRDLLGKLQSVPGVERTAVANVSLLTGGSFARGLTIQAPDRRLVTDRNVWGLRVTPGFFATVGTRLVAGRDFEERDTRPADDTSPFRTVIVNQSFAQRYFGGRNPVGARVGVGTEPETSTTIEIIGLIEDISYISLRSTEREHIFFPFWDQGSENGSFYVSVRGEPAAAFASVRAAVADVDPTVPITGLTTFGDQMTRSLTNERMLAALSSGFGSVALLMSVVGLYGVMAFVATQRTREIGVRLALGATRSAAVWLVVRDAVLMVGAGMLLALPVGWALGRIVEAQLFGVRAFDAPTIAAASSMLAMIALTAATLPAWRAAMLPPMVAIGDQPASMWHVTRLGVRRAIRELKAVGDRSVPPPVTLIRDFTSLVQRAASFPEAQQIALEALRERIGADFVLLLEKAPQDDYRGGTLSIPARGILVNRLTHYPHPLPLAPEDYNGWLQWAREFRLTHVTEIERLRATDARLAVALRTTREIVALLLVGPSRRHAAFTEAEAQILAGTCEVLALMIENARLNERALEQEKVRRDLALAAEVQRRLLPPQPPTCAAATLAAFTLPARTVGGDYYDFLDLGDDRIGIAVADVAGKGIAAALLMSVVQASLRVIASERDLASAQLAARLNQFLYQSTAANHYATFFYAQLDAAGGSLSYVNAGHNPPYLVRRTGDAVEIGDLSAGGTVLGLFSDAAYEAAEVELRPGDLFVAFTDGVTEALNASGEEFGEERLKDVLRGALGAPAEDVAGALARQMRDWIAGAEQHDDLTFVIAAITDRPRPH